MAGKWQTVTVDQIKANSDRAISIGPFGSRMKSDAYVAHGVPVIRGNNISDTRALVGDFVFVSEHTADDLRSANVFAGDLIFPHRGAIGLVGIVPVDDFDRYMLSTSLMKLSCNHDLVDPIYVLYFFRSPRGRHALLRHASTVGTPGIGQPLSSLRSIELPLPPLTEQRAIAHILGTLDDKIELNRRMSETLEAMARALFKSWFVDFDPVRAKAEGRDPGLPEPLADLFPARLVDSELGEVPEGWSVGYIGDLLDQVREPTNPMESPSATFRHFSLPAFDDGRSPANELGANIKSLKSRVSPDSILLSKLNPEIERVWLVDVAPEDRAVCSTEFLVLRPRDSFGRAYAYCLLRSPTFRNRIEGLVTGTSKSHQRAHAGAILDLPGLIPPKPTVAAFERVASPWLIRTLTSRRESGTLASLRDTLLPKLISGELRVKDAERFVEAAA
jgi:type I restriction enzyme, S subunit